MPVLDGRFPSNNVRLGQHTGEAVWALVKFTARLASRSRLGVCTCPRNRLTRSRPVVHVVDRNHQNIRLLHRLHGMGKQLLPIKNKNGSFARFVIRIALGHLHLGLGAPSRQLLLQRLSLCGHFCREIILFAEVFFEVKEFQTVGFERLNQFPVATTDHIPRSRTARIARTDVVGVMPVKRFALHSSGLRERQRLRPSTCCLSRAGWPSWPVA